METTATTPKRKNKKSGDTVDGSEILHHLVYMKS